MTAAHYTIRNATEADVPAILKMHAQSWLDTYPNESAGVSREWVQKRIDRWMNDEGIEKRRERVRQALKSDDLLYMVAEDDRGEIIGMISPYRDENVQRIGAIYVAKEHHGSGVAQLLMDRILSWADPKRPIELQVASYNERAKAFYRKQGFKEVEDSERIVHDTLPAITMIRKGEKE